jgi:hypothetical protein
MTTMKKEKEKKKRGVEVLLVAVPID